jgi:16S rRNA (guanine(527)-N(7))-methyltransferase RsmG
MASTLPRLTRDELARSLARLAPEPLSAKALEALYQHYLELARWNESVSLIGPGTAGEVVTRHYAEALAALPLISRAARQAVDIGSGAGFPGLVLAAARPDLQMTLVEGREKKWAFLMAAVRRASLPCQCLNARVANPLPAGLPERIDLLTVRALKLDSQVLGALAKRLSPQGSVLLWAGEADPDLPPDLAPGRSLMLAGSERRRILELRRRGAMAETE